MPAPLSVDLRQRIIAAYQAEEGSQRQLAVRTFQNHYQLMALLRTIGEEHGFLKLNPATNAARRLKNGEPIGSHVTKMSLRFAWIFLFLLDNAPLSN